MIIHSIKIRNFRNLGPFRLNFSHRANFISGLNGQGKTNLLESIYWLLTLSGKKGTLSDAIKTGETSFTLEAEITFSDLRHDVKLTVEGRSRKLLINGIPPKRRRLYLEQVLVVDFFPEDLLILLMEPSLRRRFLDIACVQYFLPHEDVLRKFKRLLEHRNSLLRNENGVDLTVLDTFDFPLASAAADVVSARLHLLAQLTRRTDEIFRDGIGEKYSADIAYLPATRGIPHKINPDADPDTREYEKIYLSELKRNRGRDIDSRRTSVGPHLDDFSMSLDGKPVRTFASRGETRSAMFALHLARFHVLAEKRGIRPVVLIDDVMSELDSRRRRRVLELLPPGQVFLTSCDPPPDLEMIANGELFHFTINAGKAERAIR